MIGTVEYVIGAFHYNPTHTTPDLLTNHKMLREMCLQKCQAAVMEVTSHALDQGRVDQIHYNAVVYTNLTHEHLDYHRTMEEYAAAKRKLFTSLSEDSFAIVNVDCPWAEVVTRGTKAKKITYAIVHDGDLRASDITMDAHGTKLILSWQGQKEAVFLPCIGEFNIYNAMAAAAVALSRGLPLSQVIELLAHLPRVPGRLEKVANTQGLSIFVDFAHTEDALRHALKALRPLCRGKLVVIFGCGGDRDQEKRPLMGKAAEEFADRVIITTDNPRRENPPQILQDILKGMIDNRHQVISDRRQAIEEGIKHLQQGDILLIAGRGHERSQIFANQILDFHDVTVAEELCRGLR
jgi:UDP-N-acetylmuramoyl-L-alanyl-D-glutamate--2,6-diaminopimelate ligase